MGCCVSTHDENNANPKQNALENDHIDQHFSCVSKSPPRPEEETVKEVLSETPKPETDPGIKRPKLLFSPRKPFVDQKLLPGGERKYYSDPSTPEHDIPEVSEIHTLGDTNSTTSPEERQITCEVPQRVYTSQGDNSNFPLKNCHHNGYGSNHNVQLKNLGRSHVRRANPSPPRRYLSPGRVGSGSARLSQSPVTRTNVGRSMSARRTGISPGRVRMVHGLGKHGNVDDDGNEWAGPRESLENPLVSLECFIFL